jgi:hypothetical protein
MTRYLPIALTLLMSTLSTAAPVAKKPPALGALVMDGPDDGHVTYADKCSNGANSDEANRKKYIAAMLADKKSRLATTLAETVKNFVADVEVEAVLGDWEQTFHLRDGCGETDQSFSALLLVRSKMGNSHELWAKYLVTIDDDVVSELRKFSMRSIQPLVMREQP